VIRVIALLAGVLLANAAAAQNVPYYMNGTTPQQGTTPVSPTTPLPVTGPSGSGVPTVPFQQTGAGSLSVTSSVAINTMTVTWTANGLGSVPTKWTNLIPTDHGASDIAVCVQGGTCTCPANGIAATNGITLSAGGGGYQFNWPSIAAATPTIVSCSGLAVPVDFVF
jgi:hypothetical protein